MSSVYLFLLAFQVAVCVTAADLYPSGPDAGDTIATVGDDLAVGIIPGPVKFYGTTYDQFWINVNGPLSFQSGFRDYTESTASDPQPFIAAYWNDLRLINGGELRFRRSESPADRDLVKADLALYGVTEEVDWVAVVTWYGVPYFGSDAGSERNTVQIAIAKTTADDCNLQRTYAVINYDQINWGPEGVAAANKGGDSGVITQLVPFSGVNMSQGPTYSNVGVDGRVVWRIDQHELSPLPPPTHTCTADASAVVTAFDGSSEQLGAQEKFKFSSAKQDDADPCRYLVRLTTNFNGALSWVAWNVGVHPVKSELNRFSLALNKLGTGEVVIRGFEKNNYDDPTITTFPFEWTDGSTTVVLDRDDQGAITLVNCDCDYRFFYNPEAASPELRLTVGDRDLGTTDGFCGGI